MPKTQKNDDEPTINSDRCLRLILTNRVWQTLIRQLSRGSALGGFALLRQHGTPVAVEFLCEELQLTDSLPDGNSLRPMEDWLYISLHRPGGQLPENVRAFNVHQCQTMIWLMLDQSQPDLWKATVQRHGRSAMLAEIHVVGSGMVRLLPPASAAERIAPTVDPERWSRTRGPLGDVPFSRLRNSVVTLLGAGRNGTLLAFQLAALGVSGIRLMDADTLQLHNMDANPGVAVAACGLPKVKALGSALRMFRPDMTVQVIEQQATYRTLEAYLCERSDLVVTCVDSDAARLGVALLARRNLLVHLDVATSIQRLADGGLSMTGDASLLLPTEGCCSCVGGFANAAATRHDLAAPPNSLRRMMRPKWDDQRVGSLVTLNSMVVGAAVQSWLDLLTGAQTTSVWHRFAWTAGQGLRCDSSPMQAADNCEICHMFRPRSKP